MAERYDFDNAGNRLVGPGGIYMLASEYDLLEKSAKYFGECNARNANEANLMGKRVKDLESALRQARPYVYNAEVADAADLEARYSVLSEIDALLPQSDGSGGT